MEKCAAGTIKYLLSILVCCCSLAAAGPGVPLTYAEEGKAEFQTTSFIKEVITAYGGEKTLANIKSVYSKGSIQTFMRNEKGISTRYFKRPRKLRAELFYPHSSETRIVNGFKGWRGSDTVPLREVQGPPYLAMVYQFKYLDLPFGFLDKGYRITHIGRETASGVPVEVLQLDDDEGPTMRIYIDSATRLITRVVGTFGSGKESAELSAEFSDYRDVQGIKVPYKVVNYSGNNRIAETVLIEVQVNKEMPDLLFQP
jgi:zinc protease